MPWWYDLQVSRQCYNISRNAGNLIDILFVCNTAEHAFGVNPRGFWDSHTDLKLAPDGARMTVASILLIRERAPLEALVPFGGATC